jgi:hypothetical protein
VASMWVCTNQARSWGHQIVGHRPIADQNDSALPTGPWKRRYDRPPPCVGKGGKTTELPSVPPVPPSLVCARSPGCQSRGQWTAGHVESPCRIQVTPSGPEAERARVGRGGVLDEDAGERSHFGPHQLPGPKRPAVAAWPIEVLPARLGTQRDADLRGSCTQGSGRDQLISGTTRRMKDPRIGLEHRRDEIANVEPSRPPILERLLHPD